MIFNKSKIFILAFTLVMPLFLTACAIGISSNKTHESVQMELSASMRGITIAIDKLVYSPDESIVVMVSGITQEMIDAKAFLAIFESVYDTAITYDMRQEYQYLSSDSDILTFTAPNVNGCYEMRLYIKEDYAVDALFVTMVFTVIDGTDKI